MKLEVMHGSGSTRRGGQRKAKMTLLLALGSTECVHQNAEPRPLSVGESVPASKCLQKKRKCRVCPAIYDSRRRTSGKIQSVTGNDET